MLEISREKEFDSNIVYVYSEMDKAENICAILEKSFSAFVYAKINNI